MDPLISVLIPHYNRAALLAETLQSLVNQSYPNWEAIVVDDGSEPEEWNTAQQFADSRVRFLKRTDGMKGPSRCRNIGLKASTGRFVMFVDSDDLVAPWCLKERVRQLDANPEVAFCVFPVMLFRKTPGDTAKLWNRLEGDNDLERFLRSDPAWHTSSPLWRRQAIEQLGGFDEQIMYGDDADLHMRTLLAGIPYEKVVGVLPDMFVRRTAEDRITNTVSDRLLDSRMIRLERGTRLLQQSGTAEQCRQWEGQYLIEAEFLLFCVPGSRKRQIDVLKAWRQAWTPGMLPGFVATTYMSFARATRNRLYIALRLARRLAMMFLPESFFSLRGGFESVELSSEMLLQVRNSVISHQVLMSSHRE